VNLTGTELALELPSNRTKIVATIGPASHSPAVMEVMIRAGMTIARLNFSHGDFDSHGQVIADLRLAAAAAGRQITVMADLPGPKIRIGQLVADPVELRAGDHFTLTTDDVVGTQQRASVTFDRLPRVVRPGDTLFLNDGYIQLEVVQVRGAEIECLVTVGGELRSRKGLNVPRIDLGISAFTERDRECLAFALEHGVDAVSQSFVERAAEVHAVRQAARALGHHPFVIAKIERARALENLDEILDAADGVMIARGDLGVEVPIETIALVQKDLMRRANQRAKPIITATQMLESMATHPLPTRAEATDVANAILDGTDCVMLSAESAMGKYPVEAVAMLAKIAATVEPTRRRIRLNELFAGTDLHEHVRPEHLMAAAVEACFEHAAPAAVVVPTRSGASARRIAQLRLPVWTIAVSSAHQTCQQVQFSYGVTAVHEANEPDDWNDYVRRRLLADSARRGLILLTAGPSSKHPEDNYRLEIIDV
jgi:pyruvate kinase